MIPLRTVLAALLLCFWSMFAGAQQELEIIELRSSSVERVLPALRPLLEPGATLSGMNNQLFLRASARNRAEIRRALAAIDVPPRQLVIRVSRQREADGAGAGLAVGQARVWGTREARQDNAAQMVRTLEGSPAFIQVGQSLPVPMRQVVLGPGGAIVSETTVYRDLGQGFYALPRVQGGVVTLDIRQQADAPMPGMAGAVASQQLGTTVSGRLGEWLRLGGVGEEASQRSYGTHGASTRDLREQQSIWLKVEEVQ